ncbi:MAG TPA: hypothetical protein VHB21_13375, partial [Minicystis sp.]|nr:hypothetical protein [Minicystis sp.]
EATLAAYVEGRLDDVPALRMMREPKERVRARVAGWRAALAARGVEARLVDVEGAVGGGALAEEPVPSVALAIDAPDVDALATRLRAGSPPVVARIREGSLLLDGRTVLPGEDEAMLEAVLRAAMA